MAREILKDSAITALMGLAASVFTYLFLQFLGKSLSPAEFGDFGLVLMALVGFSVVGMIYNAIVIQYIAYFLSKSQKEIIVSFSRYALYAIMLAALVIFFLVEYFTDYLTLHLHVSSPTIIRLLGIFLLFEFFGTGLSGLINGLQRFAILGFGRIIYAIAALAVGAVLVLSGFGVQGALTGLIIASISFDVLCLFFLKKNLFFQQESIGKVGIFGYIALAVPVGLSLGVLLNSDVLLAKYYLSAEDAGLYAAASLIGTLVFFTMTAIVKVMFPKVADFQGNGKDSLPILKEAIQYVAVLAGGLTFVVFVFPDFVSRFLFSKEFLISDLLRWYAPSSFFLSLSGILIMYLLALRKYSILIPAIGFAILKVAVLARFHSSALEIVEMAFWVNLALFFVILVSYKDIIIMALRKRREYFDYTELLQSR